MEKQTQIEIEAAAFRRLRDHLRQRSDVQNIEMMNLAGFCRNCLSRWYQEAAAEKGIRLDKSQSREVFYGMPFDEWRRKYQLDATVDQLKQFDRSHKSAN